MWYTRIGGLIGVRSVPCDMSQNHFLNAHRTAITVAEVKQVFLPVSCPVYTPVDFLISWNVPPTEVSYTKEPNSCSAVIEFRRVREYSAEMVNGHCLNELCIVSDWSTADRNSRKGLYRLFPSKMIRLTILRPHWIQRRLLVTEMATDDLSYCRGPRTVTWYLQMVPTTT